MKNRTLILWLFLAVILSLLFVSCKAPAKDSQEEYTASISTLSSAAVMAPPAADLQLLQKTLVKWTEEDFVCIESTDS